MIPQVPLSIPADHRAAPLSFADAQEMLALVRAAEESLTGEALLELEDLLGEWRRPSLDLARDSLGIRDAQGALVAGHHLRPNGTALAVVHPRSEGRGLGRALLTHLRELAARSGADRVGQTVPAGTRAENFLRAHGGRPTYDAWILELPLDRTPTSAVTGHVVEEAHGEDDRRAAHRVIDDAFCEWPGRRPKPYADWRAEVVERADAQPWHVRVVRGRDGDVVGAVTVTAAEGQVCFVHELAVTAGLRGHGLGGLLLTDAFAVGREQGLTTGQLSTDSRTGALGLYQHLGMEITSTWRHLEVDVP